jgi:hypothetical protein
MIRLMLTAVALAVSGAATAKLPPLDEGAKAKAAETAAKAAWQAKIDAFQLCKAQDRIAAQYRGKAGAKPVMVSTSGVTPTAAAPAAATAPPATAAPATAAATPQVPTAAAAAAPAAAKPGATAPTPATASNSGKPTTTAEGGGTPVANVAAAPAIPSCADPGPFAYAAPEQKPLEVSGAHSPAATAASPPSVKPNSAEMAPVKPGTASGTGTVPAKKP